MRLVPRLPGHGRNQATGSLPHQRFPVGEVNRAGCGPRRPGPRSLPRAGARQIDDVKPATPPPTRRSNRRRTGGGTGRPASRASGTRSGNNRDGCGRRVTEMLVMAVSLSVRVCVSDRRVERRDRHTTRATLPRAGRDDPRQRWRTPATCESDQRHPVRAFDGVGLWVVAGEVDGLHGASLSCWFCR